MYSAQHKKLENCLYLFVNPDFQVQPSHFFQLLDSERVHEKKNSSSAQKILISVENADFGKKKTDFGLR